jgi:hypothetical protein
MACNASNRRWASLRSKSPGVAASASPAAPAIKVKDNQFEDRVVV